MLTLSQLGQLLGAGTIGGLVSGEINRRLTGRAELRRHVGKALADLIDIRYNFLAIESVRDELRNRIGMDLGSHLHAIAHEFLPNWSELHVRYDAAVTEIAGFDPVLAYELRSKDSLRPLFAQIGTMATQNQQGAHIFSELTSPLGAEVRSTFDKAILRMAWRHGFITWVSARKKLRTKVELPATLCERIFAILTAANTPTAVAP